MRVEKQSVVGLAIAAVALSLGACGNERSRPDPILGVDPDAPAVRLVALGVHGSVSRAEFLLDGVPVRVTGERLPSGTSYVVSARSNRSFLEFFRDTRPAPQGNSTADLLVVGTSEDIDQASFIVVRAAARAETGVNLDMDTLVVQLREP